MTQYKVTFASFPANVPTGAVDESRLPYVKLTAAWEAVIDSVRLVLPAGFTTNFASIPRLLRALIQPTDPRWICAAVLHDFLCSLAIMPWSVNADIFECAIEKNTRRILRRTMADAVRCAGLGKPYADYDMILGWRKECNVRDANGGLFTDTIPIRQSVAGLGALAKEQKLTWLKSA